MAVAGKFAVYLLLTLVSLAPKPVAARAPTPPSLDDRDTRIEIKIAVGFDGTVAGAKGTTTPVSVKLRNPGPAFDGTVRIYRKGMVLAPPIPITLPEGGEKIVRVVLPHGPSNLIKVELIDGNRVVARDSGLEEQTLGGRDGIYVPGALAILDRRGPIPIRLEPNDVQPRVMKMLYPEPWTLPESALGYIGLRAVLWGDLSPSRLSLAQQRALKIWVERGGTLIVIPSRVASWKGSFLEDLVGLDGLVFERKGSLDRLALRYRSPIINDDGGDNSEARVALADLTGIEGRALLGGAAGPLAIVRSVSEGKVILLAFDPWVWPFPGWEGGRRFLTNIVTRHLSWGSPPGLGLGSHLFSDSLRRKGGFGTVLLLGLLFAVLVGPGIFIVLRRLRRPGAIWAAIPMLSLAAGVGVSSASPLYSRASSTCLTATWLHLREGSGRGTVSRHILYQSTARERHTLRLRGRSLGYSVGNIGERADPASQIHSSRPGRETVLLDPLRVPRWGHRLVTAWAEFELDGPIRASIRQDKDKLTFTVENLSSLDLRDAFTSVWHPRAEFASGAILEMGTIRSGEVFREEVQIPDSARRLLRGGIASSKRLGPVMKRFVGNAWYSQGSVLARIDLAEGERALAAEYDDYTRPVRQFACVVVPIVRIYETGSSLCASAGWAWTPLGEGEPGDEISSVYREWFFPELRGDHPPGQMILELVSNEKVSDQRLFDWTRQEWVTIPGRVETITRKNLNDEVTRVTISDPERFILRPEWLVVTSKIRPDEKNAPDTGWHISSIRIEGTTDE
ncbi:MAG: hypothetical protein O7H41_12040 [Planctomycetota bacterium]|nr:hypothetical protein [Planctomycetota bacterium]